MARRIPGEFVPLDLKLPRDPAIRQAGVDRNGGAMLSPQIKTAPGVRTAKHGLDEGLTHPNSTRPNGGALMPNHTPSSAASYPPPPGLCPICGCVDADAKQYKLPDGRDQVRYVCASAHEWWTTWPAIWPEDA